MDDSQIIELYFARDEEAIRATSVKYGRLCSHMAYNILNNEADTEECVNDAYLGVWNAIPPKRPDNFMAFLCKITRNLALKRLEYASAAKRHAPVVVPLSELDELLPDSKRLDETDEQQLGALLSGFLRSEKVDARNVFIRRYWYFDTIAQISARYAFSESKVKSMLFHTRRRLKLFLKKEGFDL